MENIKAKFQKLFDILENRELVLSIILVIIAFVFLIQLFNIQIINGATYREQAENKIVRTESISASRGEIYDRNGVLLATNKLTYNVELYRTKVDAEITNDSIRDLVDILNSNNDKIYSTFPVNENGTDFSNEYINDENLRKDFLKSINLEENATFDDVIQYYSELYAIEDYSYEDKLKIIKVKYEANYSGYSLFNSAIIAKNISKNSVAQIEEMKSKLHGINIVSVPQRYYLSNDFACHILGYVSKIGNAEYNSLKDSGYTINSVIGKSGIEESMEKYLKGENGTKKVVTDSLGNVTSELVTKEATSGNNVTLTIDYRIQQVVENALKTTLNNLQSGASTGTPIPEAKLEAVLYLMLKQEKFLLWQVILLII